MGQVRVVAQGRAAEEGGRQGRGHGWRRRRGVSTREALGACDEAWERLQGGGGGDGGGEPGLQLQPRAQGAAGGAAEGEQGGGGGVLELNGADLQLLLPTPLGPPVLEPHLKKEKRKKEFNFLLDAVEALVLRMHIFIREVIKRPNEVERILRVSPLSLSKHGLYFSFSSPSSDCVSSSLVLKLCTVIPTVLYYILLVT